jgi:DNA-binding response OmpR family regulator
MAAGCDSVVTKPCIPKDLEAEVRRQLAARSERS